MYTGNPDMQIEVGAMYDVYMPIHEPQTPNVQRQFITLDNGQQAHLSIEKRGDIFMYRVVWNPDNIVYQFTAIMTETLYRANEQTLLLVAKSLTT